MTAAESFYLSIFLPGISIHLSIYLFENLVKDI